jgi:nucleoside-diphosphate-sugar epimerase
MLIATCLEMMLRPIGIQPPLHPRRMDFFRKSFAFSIDKAKEKLGYDPKIDLGAGAAATAAWYRSEKLI